ncbi:MAG: sigma-54 dependent transcriptional regulator [Candidatus Omnitrophica bacterium]|nr:sigma-54 dependent transcriptional regulator [Candidatus Omnitrophota bacterium]
MVGDSTLLIVDDERNTREGLKSLLEAHDYEVDTATDGYRALEIVKRDMPDIVLTDLRMPEMDGLTLLEKIKKLSPETLVIVFTAYGTVENAVKAIQSGAFHYITKPVNTYELLETLKKAVSKKKLEQENKELKLQLKEKYEFDEIIYESKEMSEIIDAIKQVAPTNTSVLIEGESGTGKELVARMIHSLSLRKNERFVPVHCASLTDTLLASELFGHERGAFTGAVQRNLGRFEQAHKGTMFLDEISEIKGEMQVKLLRVLQEGEFERVGGMKTIRVDVRIVSATNKILTDEIRLQKFREDLYYRLNVVSIKIPPLRERRDDIRPLINYYLRHYCHVNHKQIHTIGPKAMEAMIHYHWPGNVRELKNIIERMVVLSKTDTLTFLNIPADISESIAPVASVRTQTDKMISNVNIREMERQLIVSALYELNGNKSHVAKKLGISRRTLYRKLAEYGI